MDDVATLVRPAAGRVGRGIGWRPEWWIVAVVALLLAAALTWPTLRHPWTTIPGDLGDPTLQAWQVAWGGHALLTGPLHLWRSNTFFPAPDTYAYSDTLLGYAPAGMVGSGARAAVFRYNVLYVGAYALAVAGAYALVRQLGAGRVAGAVAGVGWAFAPWRLAHSGHLNVLSVGGIALCLAMLARGHGWTLRAGRRPGPERPGWAFAGWAVAAWQVSLGFGVGLPLAYALLGGLVVAAVRYGWVWRQGRLLVGRRLLMADLGGAALFGVVCVVMGGVYLRVVALNPQARRDLSWTRMFSPPFDGFFVAPGDSWLWGDRFAHAREQLSWPPEMALMPGVTLVTLGVLGLVYSAFRARYRILLGAGVLVGGALGMGSNFGDDGEPGYLTLSRLLPGWDALRTPGRLMVWTSLLLAVLAAGMVTELSVQLTGPALGRPAVSRRLPPAVSRWLRLVASLRLRTVLVIPLAAVVIEGVNTTPHPEVPVAPAAFARAAEPILVLPSDGLLELNIMLWSTDGFPRVANGLAGFTPTSQDRLRQGTASFPDPASVALLRENGIRSVVVLPAQLGGTPWAGVPDRPVDGLGITREQVGDALVYRLPG